MRSLPKRHIVDQLKLAELSTDVINALTIGSRDSPCEEMFGTKVKILHQDAEGKWTRIVEKAAVIAKGRYELRGLAPGRCRLSFSDAGEPALAEVDVRGMDVEQDLTIGPDESTGGR